MLTLAGYADRLSVRNGETIGFHIANATDTEVSARLVRVLSADPNPAAGGVRTMPIGQDGLAGAAPPSGAQPARPPLGSFAVIDRHAALDALGSFTLVLTIWPTFASSREQVLFRWSDTDGSQGLAVCLAPDGSIGWSVGGGAHGQLDCRLAEREWATVVCTFDRERRRIALASLPRSGTANRSVEAVLDVARVHGATLSFAGPGQGRAGCFNGKLERPMLFDRVLAPDEVARIAAGETPPGLAPHQVACWDFSRGVQTSRVTDIGPQALHGRLVNTPTRAVRGSNWTGREQCFRHAPDQYGAIHFHDDDIDDCRWPATHAYTVPKALPSGAYALLLEAGGEVENIPFFVVPPKGTATAKLAVLISTFTYTVYGNHARPEYLTMPDWRAAWEKQAEDWNAYPHNPGAHIEYGLSTYNHHTDGSGIAIASWHRPMLNVRIGYVTYPYPDIRGSGLRHFPADTHLLAWLEEKGFAYDLITDWELHHEGADLLKRYTCVMTGSHPEYHTEPMLDAIEDYTGGGGRLMYLGGNGFYWKIALSPEKAGVIEIRRAEGGIRAWAAEPGEYYNQFDGEYGGLWRRNARPPQKLVGVGFTAQGNFVGSPYRIKPEARANPAVAWMFDGVAGDIVGDFGFSGHGAAGFELDRADVRLGTPAEAIVVAQSENHPPEAPWVLVPEEMLTHLTTFPGKSHRDLIRADMTVFPRPHGGAVFSTGSITYCGSLPYRGFDNPVSRLTENVLRRFLAPEPPFQSV